MSIASAREELTLSASVETFFDVVTDVGEYPEFLTGMRAAKVLSRDGAETVAEFRVHYFRDYSYTLAMTYDPLRRLSWKQVEGPFNSLVGSWTLIAAREDTVRVEYAIAMDIAFFMPAFLTQLVLSHSFPNMLKEFRERIEAEERHRRRQRG